MSLLRLYRMAEALADDTGELGKLDLTVPPYLNINHDTEAKQVELSIQDASKKNQKEMWGTSLPHWQPAAEQGKTLTSA